MARIKKIIPYFFIIALINYYASVTLFSHIHIIHGASVSHSHIHTDGHHDTKSGGHSEQSITLIAQISQFECSDALFVEMLHATFLPNKPYFAETTHSKVSIYLENISLRAPPKV